MIETQGAADSVTEIDRHIDRDGLTETDRMCGNIEKLCCDRGQSAVSAQAA